MSLYGVGKTLVGVFSLYLAQHKLGMLRRDQPVFQNIQGEDFPIVAVKLSEIGFNPTPLGHLYIRGIVEKIEKRLCLSRGHCKRHDHREVHFLKDAHCIDYSLTDSPREGAVGMIFELGSNRLEIACGKSGLRLSAEKFTGVKMDDFQIGRLRNLLERSFVSEHTDEFLIDTGLKGVVRSRIPLVRTSLEHGVLVNGVPVKEIQRFVVPRYSIHKDMSRVYAAVVTHRT